MAKEQKPIPQDQPDRTVKTSPPGVILRIVLVLAAGTIIGAVIYFSAVGWIPYIEQRIFQPIENNRARLDAIVQTQQSLDSALTNLSQTQAAGLADHNQVFQSTLEALQSTAGQLEDRVDDLAADVEANTNLSATHLPALLETLESRQGSQDRNLSALATAQMRDALGSDELELLRILDLLARTNQYLLHDNFGLAADQLETARNFVRELQTYAQGLDPQFLEDLLFQIEGALNDLPSRPSLAEVKLELAWQLTLDGFRTRGIDGSVTPTPFQLTPPAGTPTPTPN